MRTRETNNSHVSVDFRFQHKLSAILSPVVKADGMVFNFAILNASDDMEIYHHGGGKDSVSFSVSMLPIKTLGELHEDFSRTYPNDISGHILSKHIKKLPDKRHPSKSEIQALNKVAKRLIGKIIGLSIIEVLCTYFDLGHKVRVLGRKYSKSDFTTQFGMSNEAAEQTSNFSVYFVPISAGKFFVCDLGSKNNNFGLKADKNSIEYGRILANEYLLHHDFERTLIQNLQKAIPNSINAVRGFEKKIMVGSTLSFLKETTTPIREKTKAATSEGIVEHYGGEFYDIQASILVEHGVYTNDHLVCLFYDNIESGIDSFPPERIKAYVEELLMWLEDDQSDLGQGIYIASLIGKNDTVNSLVTEGVDITQKVGRNEYTPLHVAAICGHTEVVRTLLNHMFANNISLDLSFEDMMEAPLFLALRYKQHQTVKAILECDPAFSHLLSNIDPRILEQSVAATMPRAMCAVIIEAFSDAELLENFLACSESEKEKLLDEHFHEKLTDEDRKTLKEALFEANCSDTMRDLIELEIVNSLLMQAIFCHDSEMVALLLSQDTIRVKKESLDDWLDPLMLAYEHSNPKIVNLLLEHGAKTEYHSQSAPMVVSKYGVARGYKEEFYAQPILIAAQNGWTDTVKILLDRGANYDITSYYISDLPPTEQGCYYHINALHLAARFNNLNLLDILIEEAKKHAADENGKARLEAFLNHKNNLSETPLHIACRNGNLEFVNRLLDLIEVDPNLTDNDGITPLGVATGYYKKHIVERLLKDERVIKALADQAPILVYIMSRCQNAEIAYMLCSVLCAYVAGIETLIEEPVFNGNTPQSISILWDNMSMTDFLQGIQPAPVPQVGANYRLMPPPMYSSQPIAESEDYAVPPQMSSEAPPSYASQEQSLL